MAKRVRSFIALILVVVMALSLCGITALADTEEVGGGEEVVEATATPDPTEEPADPTEEPADPTEEPEVTEEPADPTEEPADPTEEPEVTEEPADPTEEPEATEEPTDPTEEPEVTEEPADPTEEPEATEAPAAESPVGEEEEPALVMMTIGVTASDGAVIVISGLLPQGASVTAYPVTVELDDGEVLAAYDITIWDAEGAEVQPTASVSVSISTPAIEEAISEDAEGISVYHMEDAASEPEEVAGVSSGNGKVSFEADSFSIYAIAVNDEDLEEPVVASYGINVHDTLELKNYDSSETNAQNGNWSIYDESQTGVVELPLDVLGENTITITAEKVGTAVIRCSWSGGHNDYEVTVTEATVNTDSTNITMVMYNLDINGDNNSYQYLESQIGGTSDTNVNQGLVQNLLVNGWPWVVKTNQSLQTIFNSDTVSSTSVTGLFQRSGSHYYYNSMNNAATLSGSSLIVYANALITPKNSDSSLYSCGNFLPFNSLGSLTSDYFNESTSVNGSSKTLYLPEGYVSESDTNAEYHFALYMTADFAQLAGGQVNNEDMTFTFSGDDDLWVFIDGVLVIDLGGRHSAAAGSINFATGAVSPSTVNGYSNLYDIFYNALGTNFDSTDFKTGTNTFTDYTTHTITMVYMERGAYASDLALDFNLLTIPQNSVTVYKNFVIDGNAVNAASVPDAFDGIGFELKGNGQNKTATYDDFSNGSYLFGTVSANTKAYTVEESDYASVSGYVYTGTTVSVNGGDADDDTSANVYISDSAATVVFTNYYKTISTPDELSYTVTKEWVDKEYDSDPPTSVFVQLYDSSDSTIGGVVELNSGNNWTYTWTTGLVAGTEYYVKEVTDLGSQYTVASAASTDGSLSMTTAFETINPNSTTSKNIGDANLVVINRTSSGNFVVWTEDELNQRERAAIVAAAKGTYNQITVTNTDFYSGSSIVLEGVTITDNSTTGCVVDFSDPSVWSSLAYGTYTSNIETDYTITNTYEPPTKSLTIEKDVTYSSTKSQTPNGSDTFSFEVTFGDGSVNATGTSYVENGKYTFSLTDGGSFTITGIPNGTAYSIDEVSSPTGYSNVTTLPVTGTLTSNATETVTNHYFKSLTTSVSGTKSWVDSSETAVLPDSITVSLYRSGTVDPIDSTTATSSGGWAYEFTNLPLYGSESQIEPYTYTVKETAMDGATLENGRFIVYGTEMVPDSEPAEYEVLGCWTSTSGNADNDYVITNTWTPAENSGDGSFYVQKYDEGETPLSGATFTLEAAADGGPADFATVEQTTGESGKILFDELPTGNYVLTETQAPSGYSGAGPWTIEVTDTGKVLVSVQSPDSGNVFTNIWNWIVNVTGGSSLGVTGTLEVNNTPLVTDIEKTVMTTAYTATDFEVTDYSDATWAASADFTGLVPGTTSVTALFKVVITGTPGASLSDYSDVLKKGDTTVSGPTLVSPDTVPSTIPDSGDGTGTVTLYYTAALGVSTTTATYTNKASVNDLFDTATVTTNCSDWPGKTVTVKYWFEDSYGLGTYSQDTTYPDEEVTVNYGGSVSASDHYLSSVPSEYDSTPSSASPASVSYSAAPATINIYYDLSMPSTSFTVYKVWDHGSGSYVNPAADRPTEVTVKLQKNDGTGWVDVTGSEKTISTTGTSANTATWTGLDEYVTGTSTLMQYRAVETKIGGVALDGTTHIASSYLSSVTSEYNENTEHYEITNTYQYGTTPSYDRPDLTIVKVGSDGETPITSSSATFTLTKSGETTGTDYSTSTVDGSVTIENLAEGTYTLVEKTAPTGYTGSGTTWTVVVTETDMTVTGPVNNVFTNVYHWIISSLTGDKAEGEEDYAWNSETNTLTVENALNSHSIYYYVDDALVKTYTPVSYGTDLTSGYDSGYTTPTGYTFHGWFGEAGYVNSATLPSTMPDEDVYLYGYTTANSGTEYTVEHYTENLDGTWALADTDDLTGTTGGTASYDPNTYTGFTYDSSLTTFEDGSHTAQAAALTIAGDGSLLIKLYYTRNSYDVTVTKSFSGVDALPTDFEITYGESGSLVLSAATGSGTAAAPYTWTVSLPYGSSVTFTEGNYGVTYYSVASTVDGATGTSKTITVPASSDTTIAFVNTYKYVPNGIELTATKVWNDKYEDYDFSSVRPISVRFALFDSATDAQIGEPIDVTNTSDETDSYSVTFYYDGNQHTSGVYVSEIGYTDSEGYHESSTVPGYSVSGDGTENNDYVITNSIITGWLTLEKIFTGSEVNANPTFTVVGQNLGYTATLTLDDDFTEYDGVYYGGLTLPIDTYVVTESNADVSGYSVTTYYSVGWNITPMADGNSGERVFTLGSSVTVEIEENEYLVVFKNDYTPNRNPIYYTLTVNWVDDEGNALPGATPETDSFLAGSSYNAGNYEGGSSRTFTDYTYSGLATGSDPETGYMNGNREVTFVYNPVIPEESPPTTSIPGDDVPLDDSPKTGDNTPIALLWLLFCASFCGLVVLTITAPKRRPDKSR